MKETDSTSENRRSRRFSFRGKQVAAMVVIVGLCLALMTSLSRVTEADAVAYKDLETRSETSRRSGDERTFVSRQRREGVRKRLFSTDKGQRRPCFLEAEKSEFTIKKKNRRMTAYETLKTVICDAQEEIKRDPVSERLVQRLCHLEAERATYDYGRMMLSAKEVKIVRHVQSAEGEVSWWPPGKVLMTGYAPSAKFHVLQRSMEASGFRGTVFASEAEAQDIGVSS